MQYDFFCIPAASLAPGQCALQAGVFLHLWGVAMSDDSLPTVSGNDPSFEQLKRLNEHGAEYWSGRDLQPLLGYTQWRSFEKTIAKAITSCEQSGNTADHHFARARKVIVAGKGAKQEVGDYLLSRFACYLIAQNGDSRKPQIALAQKYFAIQARRQELSDEQTHDLERLELRKQASEEFKALSGAARQAGVQSVMFGVFHDAGYKGMYGGLGCDQIKTRKGIPCDENLMDRMDTTELAANQFRMTQTRDKLARQGIKGQQQAIETHRQVGQEVRQAIRRIGGIMPENLKPAEHIKQVEQRLKNTPPKLALDDKDALGLIGPATTPAQADPQVPPAAPKAEDKA
jgi:DNA-damage-inducible protein D